MTTAQKLTKIRKIYGMTQEEFATYCRLNPTTYADWERGKYKPKITSIAVMAMSLGTTISDILEGVTQ